MNSENASPPAPTPRTAAYDAAIAGWFGTEIQDWFPPIFTFGGGRIQTMRYGENPHQHAAFYRGGEARPGVTTARVVQGKELSYNNVADTDAAFELVAEFDPADQAAVAIIKHANPCGVATGADVTAAYQEGPGVRSNLCVRRDRGPEPQAGRRRRFGDPQGVHRGGDRAGR